MRARPSSRAGMHPHHWADLMKAIMKFTDDFDTNQYVFGWVVGANPTSIRPEDMPARFQEGFTDGRAAIEAVVFDRYPKEKLLKRKKTNGTKKVLQDQGRNRDSV